MIISSQSDPFILTEYGLHTYAKSIGFSKECLGLHYGHIHEADLGDGLGRKPEQLLYRQDYFPVIGTCWESVKGGHHFRAWKQNGTIADSGAWFLGCVISYGGPSTWRILIFLQGVPREGFFEESPDRG